MGTTNFDIIDAAGGVTVNGSEVINSSGKVVADIVAPAGSISNAELADMATKTYKGRTAAGTGVPADVPVATLKSDLGLTKDDVGLGNVANTAQVTSVTGTAPIASSGGTTPAISITAASGAAAGSMSSAHYTKLEGLPAAPVTSVTGTAPVASSGGATPAISMAAATAGNDGYATSVQITKLDGIAAGANLYVHPNHTGEVTSLADGATTIAANAVTTAKILDANVTAAKLAPGVFTNTYGYAATAPVVADVDRILIGVPMTAAAYTIDNASSSDALCRNVSVTHTSNDATDTLGNLVVDGTDYSDAVIQETIAVGADTTTYGTKAFKTVTGLQTAGWVIDGVGGVADTIQVGIGPKIGLSFIPSNVNKHLLTTLGTGVINAPTVTVAAGISGCTVDASSGTYDGSKNLATLWNV